MSAKTIALKSASLGSVTATPSPCSIPSRAGRRRFGGERSSSSAYVQRSRTSAVAPSTDAAASPSGRAAAAAASAACSGSSVHAPLAS